MSAAGASPPPGPARFLEIWSESFAQVLGQIAGSAPPCAVLPEAPAGFPAAAESDLWVLIACAGSLRGEMAMRLAAAAVLGLAQIFMGEPPAESPPTGAQPSAEQREALIELLRQVAGIAATGAKARWGEIQLGVEQAPAAPSWPAAANFWLRAGDGPAQVTVEFGLSAALAAELRAEKAEAAKPAAPPAASPAGSSTAAPPSPAIPPAPPGEPPPGSEALDRLMDVQLAMTLRFGSKTLLLREVLDLSPGSVVELDRKVQEPVDLLLEGRLVARGDLVVIDGNYGLRVTDVSPLGAGQA